MVNLGAGIAIRVLSGVFVDILACNVVIVDYYPYSSSERYKLQSIIVGNRIEAFRSNYGSKKSSFPILRTASQEFGRTREINLLRKLELEDWSSVEEYVDDIISTSYKLKEIGFKLDDEWLSLILLMELPRRYKPMIVGFDAPKLNLTVYVVKSKILQDVTRDQDAGYGDSSGALQVQALDVSSARS